MYLKSISGNVIFEGYFHTIKRAVEAAVRDGINLDYIDLRNVNLTDACLDGAQMKGACLWGADCTNADLSEAMLDKADFRNAQLKDCCLAEARCTEVDFRGSYFSQTILRSADLSYTKFSCPSILSNDLYNAQNLTGAIYSHKGEVDCDLSDKPIVIQGLEKPIVLFNDKILIGNFLYDTVVYKTLLSNFSCLIEGQKKMLLQDVA